MSDVGSTDDIQEYVRQNRNFLAQVFRHGNTEARAYALALLANGGTTDDLEQVLQELDKLRENGKE